MKSVHPGLLLSFKAACQQSSHTITTPTKRKPASDCDEVEDAEIQSRQATLEEAFQPKSAKKKEFDGYVLDYIIEGLLPLKHVDSPAFIKLMRCVSPVSATIGDYRTDTFLKLHRSLVGNEKKHQYCYRNRTYFILAILTTLLPNSELTYHRATDDLH
ncbi:hypothetical protein OUZ56_008824 [Daphnia magna]|uniref:Uncharacterized protein n=1 Tax=Daphnia magna TaxID=35525 RepID=A0ABR0AE57_9CRUS|nr:hypothetical protein OUZ56_008824 [Daphnia magna]